MESTIAVSKTTENLPRSSVRRLYGPEVQANSFSLDGFPSCPEGQDWRTRLQEVAREQGPLGMTTNQTLFRQLLEAGALDGRLAAFKARGRTIPEIYQILYNEAAVEAARIFLPINAQWAWEGRVSQEASALLTELTPLVKEIRRISQLMAGVGAFTKIPNLPAAPRAIAEAVSGEPAVQPNVTLVFSDLHYLQTVEGYLTGLIRRAENLKARGLSEERIREDLSRIHSVNSLFVSRVDRVVDPMIDEKLKANRDPALQKRLALLKGKVAAAQAKKIYEILEAVFLGVPFQDPRGLYRDSEGQKMLETIRRLGELFQSLRRYGVHPQRLLIASSGVKSDQPYSSLLYVLPFLGPWAANTLPEATLGHLSRFVSGLSEEEARCLAARNVMKEPLPGIPTDIQPVTEWNRILLLSLEERHRQGIADLTADQILWEVREHVLAPRGASLRALCDDLRDKGARAFAQDEQATLKAIETKLAAL
ncbi:MAG: hypothetical protein HYS41_02365 [Candidatus Omnitrophica bacterium]|nr:hypothetical protein [Candidatus Omnitrophota bacterium]